MGVGALTGAAADTAMQVGENIIDGKPLDCINLNQVAASAAIGAGLYAAKKVTKKIVGGEKRNLFSDSSCE